MLALFTFAADSTSPYDAQFGELYYEHLSDAISAANASENGGTVTLLRDTTLAECLTISKDVTLTGEYTIYRADTYTATLFTVNAGTTLTLDGGITIDGGNEWVFKEALFNESYANNGVDISSLVYVTLETAAPIATAPICYISGTVIMNKATVKNHYAQSQNPPFVVSGGSLIMNDGASATHNANVAGASVVYVTEGGEWILNDGVELYYNYANSGDSGVAYITNSTVTMNGGDVHHNYQTKCAGLFLDLNGTSTAVMNGGHIHDNTQVVVKGKVGGVIYTDAVSFTMNGGVIERNYSNGATCIYADVGCALYLNAGIIRQENRAVIDNYTLLTTGVARVGENMLIEGAWIRFSHNDFVIDGEISSRVQFRNITEAANITGVINGDIGFTGTINTDFSSGTYNGNFIIPTNTSIVISGGVYNGAFSVADGADFSIRGGRFKQNPTEYLADGAEAFYDSSTELYSVYSGNVASFGGTEYATLAEAIAAANTAGGGEVSLLRPTHLAKSISISSDITLSGAYSVVRSDSYTGNLFTVAAGATLTLDGGITIDGGNEWVLDYDAMYAKMMSSPSSVDSLTFVTPEDNAPVATDYMFKVNGNVILNNAVVQNNYGKVLTSVFSVASGANVTLNSGAKVTHNASINVENTNKFNASVAYVAKGGVLVMNDGADISYNHMVGNNATLAYLHGDFIVNGGDIHNNSSINCGGLVVILDTTGVLTVNDGHIHENTNLVKNGANAAGAIFVYGASKFIMNGGLLEKNYSSGTTVIYAYAASSVELNGGTIRQEQRATHSGYSSYIGGAFTMGENMTIEAGSVQIQKPLSSNAAFDCDVWLGGTSTVSNGTFNRDIRAVVSTTISGGTFLGNIIVDSGKTLSIKGGRFKNDPSAYLADYHEVVYDEEAGFYTINKYYEASFGGVNYDSLEEAIAAANTAGGGTVTLLHDANLDTSITVSSGILLEGAYSVVRSDSYTGNLFTVAAGATLTLDGGITIDGGNEWTLTDEFMTDLNAGIPVKREFGYYVVPEEGAPIASTYMINVLGTVIMNNATVCNNYAAADAAAPIHLAGGATLTTNSGAILRDNCSAKSSALIKAERACTWIINEGTEIYGHYAGSNGGISNMLGQVVMNGGDVHDNYLNYGAGTFIMLNGAGSSLTMNGGHVHDNYNIPNGTDPSCVIYVHNNGIFTMNGGVIEGNHGISGTAIRSRDTSKVYLNGGVIRHEASTNPDCTYDSYLSGTAVVIGEDMLFEGGRIRIRCSEITIDGTVNSQIVSYLAQTTIKGSGTINGDVNVIDATAFVIESGKWLGKMNVAETGGLSITGGSFRENPSEWLAEGYGAVYNPDSEMYGVELTPVAAIGETKYDTITEALAAAADGDVIKIAASHKIREPITINKNVTIDTGNQTLIVDKSVAVAFVIKANTTFRGSGTVNTDNGNTAVFAIGDADTEGSLTIESGSYIGESTVAAVENGSLTISGGDFSVNPDVAEGETADHSELLTVNDSANAYVAITGGRFRSFNPDTAGGGYLEDSHDAVEENGDYYNVLTHIFEHYVSDGNATCTSDGTKTAKCKFCELTDTITEVGSMLQHAFLHYVSDGNATCDSDGTKTAKCEHCDVTVTVTDARSALGHVFENYVSDGNATCEANGTRTAKCEHCDATRTIMESRSKLPHTYDGLTCTACGHLRIWLVAIIAFCIVALLMFLPLMII